MFLILWILFSVSVHADLLPSFIDAEIAWLPYYSTAISTVRWCQGTNECYGVNQYGGAEYSYATKEIILDRDWPWTPLSLKLALEHEIGHSFGLQHTDGDSIMRPGWDLPWVDGPTRLDFDALESLALTNN